MMDEQLERDCLQAVWEGHKPLEDRPPLLSWEGGTHEHKGMKSVSEDGQVLFTHITLCSLCPPVL